MRRVASSTRTPGLLWLAIALSATAVPMPAQTHVALAAAGAFCALALPQSPLIRLTTAIAMLPVAFADAPTWAFVIAGGLLLVASSRVREAVSAPQLEGIQRHLEWCRRRDESAHLLWVHAPAATPAEIAATMASFRVTDNAALLHETEGNGEIVAMLDDSRFSREGLAERLRAHLGEESGIGWAHFPEDGVTLDALFAHARTAAVASTTGASAKISTQLRVPVRRIGPRTVSPAPRVPAQSSNQG
jgi:hypothetical protein